MIEKMPDPAAEWRGHPTFDAAPAAPGHGAQGHAWRHPPAPSLASLSRNELALMHRLARGYTNAQIGLSMHRSEKTVRNQLTHLYAKLGAGNRAEAVAIYMRMGGT